MEDLRLQYRGAVISVGGPPHSGKSVFITALFNCLVASISKEVFLERACPDGEGRWSAEAPPDHVREIRRKSPFSDEFVHAKLLSVENLGREFHLVLVDLGGKLEPDVKEFLRRSTHCILLSHSETDLTPWIDAAQEAGCMVLASLLSCHIRGSDGFLKSSERSHLQTTSQPWTGTLINLDREAPSAPYEDAIHALTAALARSFLG
jgi:CRISPR-associated protein Csx3